MNGRLDSHLCSCGKPRQAILSLDGGGIRGYGSLFILEELMRECHRWEELFDTENGHRPDHRHTPTPLPCEYFDFVAGTSTGGLIAIMIARLRMSVSASKEKYAELGRDVFGRSRWWRSSKYDHRPLEDAVKRVVKDHHPCTDNNRHTEHPLLESRSNASPACHTILYALRKKGNEDVPYVFRSYKRSGFVDESTHQFERKNRNINDDTNILIWQAARATSAAPTYFKTLKLDEYVFMDGGIGSNNPSQEAWFEVHGTHETRCTPECYNDSDWQHVHFPCKDRAGGVKIMVSIGTGRGDRKSIFAKRGRILQMVKAVQRGVKELTDPERTHQTTSSKANDVDASYFRLNVEKGLEHVDMDDVARMDHIEKTTVKYFADGTERQRLEECARQLVIHRRARCAPDQQRYQTRQSHMNGAPVNGSHRRIPTPNGVVHRQEEQAVEGAVELSPRSPNGHIPHPFSEAASQPVLELRTSNSWHHTIDARSPRSHRQDRSQDSVPMSARSEGPVEMPERRDPHELPNGLFK